MVVHGGIEARETKSELFAFCVTFDKWINLNANGLPALSSHKIVSGKSSKEAYMFGGQNSKGKSMNKLYRLKNINTEGLEVKFEQVECVNSPRPRHSFCF